MIDKKSPMPLYHQIKQDIELKIKNKKYAVGELIPSESELAAAYGVSRMTIRLAVNELDKEGLVKKFQGKGTYVHNKKVTQDLSNITSWSETIIEQGKKLETKKIRTNELVADNALAEQMNIPAGTNIYFIERIRYVDNEPFSIAKNYIQANLAPGLLNIKEISSSIYKVLEENYHLELGSATEIVEAYAAGEKISRLLKVQPGAPIIKVTRLTYDVNGNTIELAEISTRADKYAYKVTITGRKRKQ